MSFADIQYQDRAVAELQSLLAADRVPHGFIFCGPAGVGKALTARALAAVLLCDAPKRGRGKQPSVQPCGKCDQCRLTERDNHPDLSWFRRPAGSAVFPIDVVTRREKSADSATINESAQFTPMQAACRVTIIEDAELMNQAAANAFLKTFEESPDGSYLVLLVTSLDRLLPTIRSRGRLIRFGTLPSEFIAELLERDHGMTAPEAATLSRFAEGSMDLAAALARSSFLRLHSEVLDALPGLDRGSALTLADALEKWAAEQADNESQLEVDETASSKEKKRQATVEKNTLRRDYLKRALGMLASVFRDALMVKSGAADGLQNIAARRLIERYSAGLPMATLERGVEQMLTYQRHVDRNVHVQLLMENACLELADLLSAART